MKKTLIVLIGICLFLCGFAVADPGINAVSEVQGLSIQTTVIGVGNFDQETEVALGASSVTYQSVYTEDTHTAGNGYISYDKSFDVGTGETVTGQYNIESTRQITYVGIDAGSIYSSEYLMTSGAGTSQSAADRTICPFGSGDTIGAFCNTVETGSTFVMSVANVATTANNRFITKSADTPVETNYHILVTEYAPGVPSKGSVMAFIQGTIKEGNPNALGEESSFKDRTEIIGDITLFDKQMHYGSAYSP